ncbi:contractile injection system tape measure protein [Serratia marcescens]|uniref:contractile injection system tape measure protein n=1 Tax=Serratia marcescens TaxID=615 RepID=UPI003FA7BE0B
MSNPAIKIHQLRVRLHTSRGLAESLQQAVSQAIHTRLTDDAAAGLASAALWPRDIARLTLDLGELPYEGFERQFIQRLVRQLSEALGALPPPEESLSESGDVADAAWIPPRTDGEAVPAATAAARPGQTQSSLSAVTPAARATPPAMELSACLLRFLHTGYWFYPGEASAVAAQEQEAEGGGNARESGPEAVIAPGNQREKRPVPGLGDSPARALAQLLSVQPAPDAGVVAMLAAQLWRNTARRRLWQNLSEQVRHRLFSLLTRECGQARVPQMTDISPAGLMLAAWHYALQPSSAVVWHDGQHENHRVLAALTPVEIDWLNTLLLAPAGRPALLAAVLPPLRRYASVWGARLSEQAQQRLWQGAYPATSGTPSHPASREPFSHKQAGDSPRGTKGAGHIGPDGPRQTAVKGREALSSALPHIEKGRRPPAPGVPHVEDPFSLLPVAPGEQQDHPLPQQLNVSNAGIVLLWPLLPRLFTQLELLEKPQQDAPYRFISPQTQQRAVWVLDTLIWGDDEPAEWRCMVNKWLCNWPLSAPLADCQPENEATHTLLTDWLSSLSVQIPGLQRCEPGELRALFLQRPGIMQEERHGWRLTVEPHPSDIMLAKLPWPLQQPTLPWLTQPLAVTWQLPQYPIF